MPHLSAGISLSTAEAIDLIGVVVWPLSVLTVAWWLRSQQGIRALNAVFGGLKRVSVFGVELELSEEGATRFKADLEQTFTSYRADVDTLFDRALRKHDVYRHCAKVAKATLEPALNSGTYRCTIYVPDILFENVLYRLTDYYPTGGGRGKTYSIRFGIIGRSWRLRESKYEPQVPGDARVLMSHWGMTDEESVTQEEKSFITYVLSDEEGRPDIGLFFAESDTSGAFADNVCKRLDESAEVRALSRAVSELMHDLRDRGPMLELVER